MFHLARFFFFFFNDTATTEIYTLSLHDALPIWRIPSRVTEELRSKGHIVEETGDWENGRVSAVMRSEEHTSELQSRPHLVCRLLLEKKKNRQRIDCRNDNKHHRRLRKGCEHMQH